MRRRRSAASVCAMRSWRTSPGQVREHGEVERPLITSGDELRSLNTILAGRADYAAADVLDYLLAG